MMLKQLQDVTLILIFISAPREIKPEKKLMQSRLQPLLLTGKQPRMAMNTGRHKHIGLV
jgi:hypothetical protein